MLSDAPFGHSIIKNHVVAFGTLFNNIKIPRGDGSTILAVPLTYAPKQSFLRATINPKLESGVSTILPRMSFELSSMTYAPDRKLSTINRYVGYRSDSNNALYATYSPVPYDLNFSLHIYVKNIEDGTAIVEQILPYFTPEFTITLKGVTKMKLNQDVPVVLTSVNTEDNYEDGLNTQRAIVWSLDFTAKATLFGPIADTGVINKVEVNLYPSSNTVLPVVDPFSLFYHYDYQPGDNIMPLGFSSFDQPEDLYHFAGSVGDAGLAHVSVGNTRPYPVTSVHDNVQVSKEIYTGGGANSYIGTTSFNINTYKIYGWVGTFPPGPDDWYATSPIHNSKLTFANSYHQNGMHLPENEEDFSSHIKIPKGKKWILSCWVKSYYSNTTADNRPDPNSVGTNLDTGANTRFFVYGSNTSTNRGQIYEGWPDHVVTPANGEWTRMVKVIDLRSSGVGNIGNSTYSETALGYANGPSTGHGGGVDDAGPSASPLNQWERMVIAIGVDFHVFSNTAYFFDGFQLEEAIGDQSLPSQYKAPRAADPRDTKNVYEKITIQPSMFANGDPTTIRSESVPLVEISANSDFGISQSIDLIIGE